MRTRQDILYSGGSPLDWIRVDPIQLSQMPLRGIFEALDQILDMKKPRMY